MNSMLSSSSHHGARCPGASKRRWRHQGRTGGKRAFGFFPCNLVYVCKMYHHSMFHCIAIQGTGLLTLARSTRSGGGFVGWLGRQPWRWHVGISSSSSQIRRHHLEFNEHLHSCFGDQRFVQAHSTRISARLIRHFLTFPACRWRVNWVTTLLSDILLARRCLTLVTYVSGDPIMMRRTFLAPFFGISGRSWTTMPASARILSQMAV